MRIKQIREQKGFTQKQVADAVGVTATTILNWANGIYEPSSSDLIKLSKFLDTSIDYLVGLDEPHQEEILRRCLSDLDKEKLVELVVQACRK